MTVFQPSKIIRELAISHKKLESAKDNLNLQEVTRTVKTLQQAYEQLDQNWQDFLEQQETIVAELQKQISDPEYPAKLESALRDQEVPFLGTFPNYDIPPLKLSINIDRYYASLSMGKKSQQSKNLAPQLIAEWVGKQYKRLVNSPFDYEQFSKELFRAYQYISESKWGIPALVKDIYQILTIRDEAKKEYPESQFIFDLSRLRTQYEVKYKDKNHEYVFDFSAQKNASKNYTVVDQFGAETKVGNLTIRRVA